MHVILTQTINPHTYHSVACNLDRRLDGDKNIKKSGKGYEKKRNYINGLKTLL